MINFQFKPDDINLKLIHKFKDKETHHYIFIHSKNFSILDAQFSFDDSINKERICNLLSLDKTELIKKSAGQQAKAIVKSIRANEIK
jgi:hypothetical protein